MWRFSPNLSLYKIHWIRFFCHFLFFILVDVRTIGYIYFPHFAQYIFCMLSRLLEIICMLLSPCCCHLLRVRCQISLLTEQIDLFLQPGKFAEDMVYCSGFSVVGVVYGLVQVTVLTFGVGKLSYLKFGRI